MFEKILEKVIDSYFGKYISGLDKNIHLSVFKGSVKIENVSFKPEIMDLLELPIDILYSNIGVMTMNIPWSKLSSSPVPISMENIYLIIGPKKQSDWNFQDKASIEKKLENINLYAKQCLDKLIQKSQKEEKSMLEKMTVKIIDNIQLSFKNIHVRWEDSSKEYSFGLTLQELQANTTDENWVPTFIDRTKSEEINKPINKLLNLSNLRLYWNQNESNFLQNQQKYKIFSMMQGLIEQPKQYKNVEVMIEINADFKLVNNQPQNFDNPLYELTIGLDWIDLQLKHQQLQQISDLINISIQYRDSLWAERKKVVEISEEMKEFYKKYFLKIYYIKLKAKQMNEKELLDQSQTQIFESILKSIDYQTLNNWVRSVVKLLARENKMNEIMNNKKSIFSSNTQTQIQVDQIKEIDLAIEKQLEQTKKNTVQRPDEAINFSTSIILKGGSIVLTKDNLQKKIVEGIKFTYTDLIIYMNTTEDKGQEIFLKLQAISINLQNQDFDSKIPESINFLYKSINSNTSKSTSSNFIQFIYKRHSIRQKKDCKFNLDGSITCFVEPIECVYNHKFIERFRDFFDIKTQHEYFSEKKQKLEQLSSLQKQSQTLIVNSQNSIQSAQTSKDKIITPKNKQDEASDKKKKNEVDTNQIFRIGIDIRIEKQTIIIPLDDANTDLPCWIFSLSRLNFKSSDVQRDIYELFNLEMKNLSIFYLQKRSLLHKMSSIIDDKQNIHKIVENFNFHITILHQQQNKFDIDKPLLQFEGVLEPLCLNFNEEILSQATKIKYLISPSYQNEQEKLKSKKEDLEKNAKLDCQVFYREKRYQNQMPTQLIIDSTDRVHLFHQEENSKTLHLNSFQNFHLMHLIEHYAVEQRNRANSEIPNIQKKLSKKSSQIQESELRQEKNQEIKEDAEENIEAKLDQKIQIQVAKSDQQEEENKQEAIEEGNQNRQKKEEQEINEEEIKQEEEAQFNQSNQNQKKVDSSIELYFVNKQFYLNFKSEKEYLSFKQELERVNEHKKQKQEMIKDKLQQQQQENENLDTEEDILSNESGDEGSVLNEQQIPKMQIRNTSDSIQLPEPQQKQQQEIIENISNVINLEFKNLTIKITKEDQPYIDFQLESLSFYKLMSSLNQTTNLQFKNFLIQDYIHKYNHSIFQPIFSTYQTQENEQFFKVIINENLKNDEIDVQLEMMKCVFNWKPDSLLILRRLYVLIFMSEQSLRMKKQQELESKDIESLINEILNDSQYKSFIEKFTSDNLISVNDQDKLKSILVDYEKSLKNNFCSQSMINIQINIKEVQLYLIQHQTHTPLLKLKIENTSVNQKLCREGNFISGSLGEFLAYNLTNYPNTVNADNQEQINEYVIIQRKEFNKSKSTLEFSWAAYNQLVTKEHFDSFLDIKLTPISIVYFQQPTMRLIDYINNQILALISYPDQILQVPSQNPSKEQPKNVFGQIDNIIKYCLCPKFMHMRAQLQQPDILLRALPNEEGFLLTFESISIENNPTKSNDRFNEKEVPPTQFQQIWVHKYNIQAEDCKLKIENGELTRELSLKSRMVLSWEQLLFFHEITYIWPQMKKFIIRGNKLRGNVSSFFMRLNQIEYTKFLKMLLHNFTYDDGRDFDFIYNYEHVSALEPNPLDVVVDFQGLSLVKTDEKFLDPQIIFSIQQCRVKWFKDSLQNIKLNILAQEMIMSVFQKIEDGFIRKDIIGNLIGCTKKYIFEEDVHKMVGVGQNIIDDYNTESDNFIDSEKYNEKTIKFNFRQSILKNSGDTDINFTIQNIKILLQTDQFMQLMHWAQPQPSCYPNYKQKDEENRLVFIFNANNVIFASPLHIKQQVIASKGQFSLIFVRQRMQKHEILREKLLNQNMHQNDYGDLYTYNVAFNDFEIFSCNFQQLIQHEFSEVYKRNLLHPTTATLKSKYELCIGPKPQQSLYFLARNEGHISKTKIKCSFKNLNLLYNTVKQQEIFMNEHQKYVQQQENKVNEKQLGSQNEDQEESKQNQIQNNQQNQKLDESSKKQENQIQSIPTNSTFDIEIEELQLHLINDAEQSSLPVIQLKLFENKFLYNFSTNNKKNLSISLCLQLCYYNSQSSFWEPILERNQFILDYVYSPSSNPKRYLTIEQQGNDNSFNINISQKMLKIIGESLESWKKQFNLFLEYANSKTDTFQEENEDDSQQQAALNERASYTFTMTPDPSNTNSKTQKKKHGKNAIENIEYISPFSIQNNIGYPIYIENEYSQSFIVNNNDTINYLMDEEQAHDYNRINSKKVSIQVLNDQHTFQPLNKVNLGYLKTKKVFISSIDQKIQKAVVVLENSTQTNRKLLQIHSMLSFQNMTNMNIDLHVGSDPNMQNNVLKMQLASNQIRYVPFDRLDNIFEFKFETSQFYSDLISLQKLMKVQQETSYELMHNKKRITSYLRILQMENETRLVFEPFIRIKNCLPMKIEVSLLIQNEKKDADEAELAFQQEMQNHQANLQSQVKLQLKVPGFQGSDYFSLSNPLKSNQQNNEPNALPIIDFRGCIFPLRLKTEIKPFGSKRFFIYAECIIISQVPNDLYYFHKNEDLILFSPGQKFPNIPQTEYISHLGRLTLFQSTRNLMISAGDQGQKISRPLNLTGIGKDTIEVYTNPNGNSMLEISADVNLQEVDKEFKIFSKVVQLNPKYIMINQTEFTIMVRQENINNEVIMIKPQERTPLVWSDFYKQKNYNVMIQDVEKQKSYGWSGTLNVALSSISFAVRNPKNFSGDVKFLKAQIKQYKHYFFIQIMELKKELNPSYVIENRMKDTNLVVYQGCFFNQKSDFYKENMYKIQSGESINYAQDLPTQKNDLIIEFQFVNERGNNQYVMEPLVLNLECPEFDNLFVVPNADPNNTKMAKFFIEIGFEGSVKKVRVLEEEEKIKKMLSEKKAGIEWQVNVNLPAIGISLIGQLGNEMKELIYLNFSQVELIIVETTKLRTCQLKIQNIQFDNNLTYNTQYPVLLTSTKQQQKIPHISLVMDQDITVNQINKFQSIRLAIQPTTLKLTDELLNSLLNFFEEFAQPILNQDSTKCYSSSDCESISDQSYQQSQLSFSWHSISLPHQQNLMCIQQMELYPLDLNLSFKKIRETTLKVKMDILQNVLKAVGVVFANVEGAQLRLKGIKYENIIETQDSIQQRLMIHYKDSFLKQTLQLLGSVNIIGNPASLIKNIGTGVSDLIEMPIDGFIKGPLEGGVGVVKGAGSLIKNTVSGTFGSVQGITDSIGSGFSQLSMDKEFIQSRDNIKRKKAKHVGHGVKLGLQSLFTGLGEGITGLVTKPIEGAEKGGAVGLLKGFTKGFAGLVFKPITGVIDAASKTAEGIKNTATYFDEKPNENRARLPRVFYSREQYYQDYLTQDSEVLNLLQKFKKGKFADIQLVDTVVLNYRNEQYVLILSIQYVLLFNITQKQLVYFYNPQDIYVINETNFGIVVYLNQGTPEIPEKNATVVVENLGERSSIIKKLTKLQDQCQ